MTGMHNNCKQRILKSQISSDHHFINSNPLVQLKKKEKNYKFNENEIVFAYIKNLPLLQLTSIFLTGFKSGPSREVRNEIIIDNSLQC